LFADALRLSLAFFREIALCRTIVQPEVGWVSRSRCTGVPEQGDRASLPQSLPGFIGCLRGLDHTRQHHNQ
jgi:hypothetical protein